jgi:demethylmenaquinone methyltransferase/2-methoxy-6-polyprenyl-1,4-benzoquinol methylase
MEDAELLAEQVAYYRARAPRYDEWWQRCGVYDRGPEFAAEWDRQVALVEEALATFSVSGHALELAGGTGWWTRRLARCAETLTVVDSSPEALEINLALTRPPPKVSRILVDGAVMSVVRWPSVCDRQPQ